MAQGHEQKPHDATPTPPVSGNHDEERKTTSEPSRTATAPSRSIPGYLLTALLALVFGMIGAYVDHHFLESPPPPPKTPGADGPAGTAEAGPTIKDLSDQVAKISDRVDGVSHRIETLPKPTPPPDLSDLQVRMAEISKTADEVTPIRAAIKRIDDHIDAMNQTIRSMGNEVRSATSRNNRTVSPTSSNTPSRIEDVDVAEKPASDDAIERGASLFQQKKYKEALDLFNKLEQTNPDDARVWYYAALAHGFTTKVWNEDGTGRLVGKGIERERAGTPSSSVIDKTFKDLTTATGKDWLATYRKRVNTQ